MSSTWNKNCRACGERINRYYRVGFIESVMEECPPAASFEAETKLKHLIKEQRGVYERQLKKMMATPRKRTRSEACDYAMRGFDKEIADGWGEFCSASCRDEWISSRLTLDGEALSLSELSELLSNNEEAALSLARRFVDEGRWHMSISKEEFLAASEGRWDDVRRSVARGW